MKYRRLSCRSTTPKISNNATASQIRRAFDDGTCPSSRFFADRYANAPRIMMGPPISMPESPMPPGPAAPRWRRTRSVKRPRTPSTNATVDPRCLNIIYPCPDKCPRTWAEPCHLRSIRLRRPSGADRGDRGVAHHFDFRPLLSVFAFAGES